MIKIFEFEKKTRQMPFQQKLVIDLNCKLMIPSISRVLVVGVSPRTDSTNFSDRELFSGENGLKKRKVHVY